jgi:hypothetical protein
MVYLEVVVDDNLTSEYIFITLSIKYVMAAFINKGIYHGNIF